MMLCSEVAMTDAEKESEARCTAMLSQLISTVKKQTSEMEDLAVRMDELAVGLKAIVQPPGAPAHALPPPVPAPTATCVGAVDHAVATATPWADATLTPESPTRCSTNCSDDVTASQTSALLPDAAPSSPSTVALLDVAIPGPNVIDAEVLDGGIDSEAWLKARPMLDAGGVIFPGTLVTTHPVWVAQLDTLPVGALLSDDPTPRKDRLVVVQVPTHPVSCCPVLMEIEADDIMWDCYIQRLDILPPDRGKHKKGKEAMAWLPPWTLPQTGANHKLSDRGISKLLLINELDESLLLVGSSDGKVCIWRNYTQKGGHKLVTAFSSVHCHRAAGCGIMIDWQQQSGYLYASGDMSSILVWDLDKEQLLNTIQSSADSGISALSASQDRKRIAVRLWRLHRVSSLVARLEKDIRFNYFWTRCSRFISVTLFAVHCVGCFNYVIADRYPNPENTWIGAMMPAFRSESLGTRYVTALYWSISTLTTTGYGDLHAEKYGYSIDPFVGKGVGGIFHSEPIIWHNYAKSPNEIKREEAAVLHSSISVHIAYDYFLDESVNLWGHNLPLWYDRVWKYPERVQNLYFTYLLFLRAVTKAADYLVQAEYNTVNPKEGLKTQSLVKQILFSVDGENHLHQPFQLQRKEFIALVNLLNRLSESDLSVNYIVKTCQKFNPVTDYYDSDHFFTNQDGLWNATPLLLTVVVIELSDIAFAVDSIPAVFGVTRDPLIFLSSNIFAIYGLRSLYVLISENMSELEYLQPAIGEEFLCLKSEWFLWLKSVHCGGNGDPLHYRITEIDGKVSMAQIRRVSGFIEKLQIWTPNSKVEQSWNHKLSIQLLSVYIWGPYFIHWDKIVMHDLDINIYCYELMGQIFEIELSKMVKLLDFSPRWNYSQLMANWKVAPALVVGCTAVLKSSELVSLTCLELGAIWEDIGLPQGVLNIITGLGSEAGAPLASHHHVDKIAFTGSTKTGKRIKTAAAQMVKPVSLELGGKSPLIVFDDEAECNRMLGFCNHGGLLIDECLYFHQMISRYKLEPQLKHFVCMVDILGLILIASDRVQLLHLRKLMQQKHGGDCVKVRLGIEVILIPWDPGGNEDDSSVSA